MRNHFFTAPLVTGRESCVAGLLVQTENPVLQIPTDFLLSSYRKRTDGLNVQARDPWLVTRDRGV